MASDMKWWMSRYCSSRRLVSTEWFCANSSIHTPHLPPFTPSLQSRSSVPMLRYQYRHSPGLLPRPSHPNSPDFPPRTRFLPLTFPQSDAHHVSGRNPASPKFAASDHYLCLGISLRGLGALGSRCPTGIRHSTKLTGLSQRRSRHLSTRRDILSPPDCPSPEHAETPAIFHCPRSKLCSYVRPLRYTHL